MDERRAMPRSGKLAGLDGLVQEALDPVVRQAAVAIARAVAEMAARELETELRAGVARAGRGRGARGRGRSRPRTAITRWTADRRARRVPNFVIEATGLKTKKQIVAKYGDGVAFEKGKPAPRPR
jgi:hypothetical protein